MLRDRVDRLEAALSPQPEQTLPAPAELLLAWARGQRLDELQAYPPSVLEHVETWRAVVQRLEDKI